VRLGAVPENPVELLVTRLGLAPKPLIETQMAFTLARLVMVGVKVGLFDALADGDATAAELAERLETNPRGTEKLLYALAGSGYVTEEGGGRYAISSDARKWLVGDGTTSLKDKLLFQFLEWDIMESAEDYVRTGEPLSMHSVIDADSWDLYQRGMRALASAFSSEPIRRLPVPKGARDMLDIGGSHGHYSCELCRRYDGLRAVVLDLPDAVDKAAPLLAEEGMGDRVVHRPGNALTDDIGSEQFDLVIIAQVVHHFTEEQNRELAGKVARALRPGGIYAILDAFRAPSAKDAGQLPALLDFYFALTSESGTWTPDEMARWQRGAGLRPRKPIRFRTTPGAGIQVADKPK
jgi:SAM-dependent methyltransferase